MSTDGREENLDEEQKKRICGIVNVGCSPATAAKQVGCTVEAIRNEVSRDRQFAAAIRYAEASHEITHMKNVYTAAQEPKDWRASVWALERTYPDRYARRDPDVVTADQLAALVARLVDILIEEVSNPEDRERIMARMAELTSGSRASPKRGKGSTHET